MADLNRMNLIGRLGRDPEVKYTQAGDAICTFSVAVSETWKGKNGEKNDKTEWFKVAVFNKSAIPLSEMLKKGAQVYVDGKLSLNTYTKKDGTAGADLSVVANQVIMLDRKADSEAKPAQPAKTHVAQPEGFEEDLPF